MLRSLRRLAWTLLGLASPLWLMGPSRRRRLRILAYHDTSRPDLFEEQLRHLTRVYRPVGVDDVVRFCRGEALAERSVWLTFDDGDPSVVDVALPLLERFGVVAAMFVCPGLIDTREPFWWQVVEEAVARGVTFGDYPPDGGTLPRIKALSEVRRREIVGELRRRLEDEHGVVVERRQLTSAELERWVGRGHTVHNHTWTHPILPSADPEEQRVQIADADRWLEDRLPQAHKAFAYPNGSHSPFAHEVLAELGYEIALLFDHRLTSCNDPLRLSRIRVNGSDGVDVFKARVSGAHPSLHHLTGGD